jgi:aminotransferase EvaB
LKIHYNYLPQEFGNIDGIITDWKRLAESTEFTLGPFVHEFEEAFKKLVNSKYCISTNNGTDALILCLKALGVGPGDEVITVNNTFYATAGAIAAVGAIPVLIDCDDRFQIDPALIAENVSKKTKAVIPVHWAGASPNMKSIMDICNELHLPVVEDACMGIGALCEGKAPGTFGKLGAFSMHPLKSLNAMGDGGIVVTDDQELYDWMYKYRNHGMIDRDHIEFWGVNMRMQPLQCIVGLHGLKRLHKTIQQRNANASILDAGLAQIKQVKIPARMPNYTETFALYMGLFEKRDELKKYLIENDVEVKIHYPIPLHKQEASKKFGKFNNNSLKKSVEQAEKLLTIPIHQFLNQEHMERILYLVKNFYS